jgi:hypothetical protein
MNQVAALPFIVVGWGIVLHFRPRWGWTLTFVLITAVGLAIWLAPNSMSALVTIALRWLVEQGVPKFNFADFN